MKTNILIIFLFLAQYINGQVDTVHLDVTVFKDSSFYFAKFQRKHKITYIDSKFNLQIFDENKIYYNSKYSDDDMLYDIYDEVTVFKGDKVVLAEIGYIRFVGKNDLYYKFELLRPTRTGVDNTILFFDLGFIPTKEILNSFDRNGDLLGTRVTIYNKNIR